VKEEFNIMVDFRKKKCHDPIFSQCPVIHHPHGQEKSTVLRLRPPPLEWFISTMTLMRVPRPGQMTCWHKIWGATPREKWPKRHGNREIAAEWAVGVWAPRARWRIFPNLPHSSPSWSWNQRQTLTDYLCCHIYCAYLGTQNVGASRAVSNKESRYPHTNTKIGGIMNILRKELEQTTT